MSEFLELMHTKNTVITVPCFSSQEDHTCQKMQNKTKECRNSFLPSRSGQNVWAYWYSCWLVSSQSGTLPLAYISRPTVDIERLMLWQTMLLLEII